MLDESSLSHEFSNWGMIDPCNMLMISCSENVDINRVRCRCNILAKLSFTEPPNRILKFIMKKTTGIYILDFAWELDVLLGLDPNLLLNLVDIHMGDRSVLAIDDLSKLLEGGAAGFDVEEVDEAKFDEDPAL